MRHYNSPHQRFAKDPNVDPDTGEAYSSLTRQEHKEECDINSILQRYETTGALPPERQGQFAYVPELDFMRAQQIMIDATNMFQALPARLRDMYDNDPGKYLAAYDKRDPALIDAAYKHGVIPERSRTALEELSNMGRQIEALTESLKPLSKPPKAGAGEPT